MRTVSDFRKRHLKALAGLFGQVLKLCEQAWFVKLGHVSLDGTKIKANASKHKAMSYERMEQRAAELEAEVKRCPVLSPVSGKPVEVKFDGGLLSSDGGVLALREVEQRLRVAD